MSTGTKAVVTIEATFPELKGGASHQQGRGQGSSVKVAAKNAIVSLLRQPKLKRKHYSYFTATVSVGRIQIQQEEKNQTCP